MIARILSLLALGFAFAAAACLSNPTPHPALPDSNAVDPNQTATVVDPNGRTEDDGTGDYPTGDPAATANQGVDDCHGKVSADATQGAADATTAATTAPDAVESNCDGGVESDTGPDATAAAASAELGQKPGP